MRKSLKFEVNAGFTHNGKNLAGADPDVMLSFFGRVSVFMTPNEARLMAQMLTIKASVAEGLARDYARRNK